MSKNLTIHERHMEGLLAKHAKENIGVELSINTCLNATEKMIRAGKDLLNVYGTTDKTGLYDQGLIDKKIKLLIHTMKNQVKLLKDTWGSSNIGFVKTLREDIINLEESEKLTEKIDFTTKIIKSATATHEKLEEFLSAEQLLERHLQSIGSKEDKIRREMGNWLN